MKRLILLSILMIMASISCGAVSADTWTAFSHEDGNPLAEGYPSAMVFTFENNHLSLNASQIVTIGGSSAMIWTLLFSGNWAACGTIDEFGDYVPDPYASFIEDEQGGYVQWANNTPSGYQAPLMLGQPFVGDGSALYTNQWGEPISEISGTLVLNTHPKIWGPEYNLYESMTHTFTATEPVFRAVPEPSCLAGLFAGVASLLGVGFGRRKKS